MLSPFILSTISDTEEGVGRGSRTRPEKHGQYSRAQLEKAKAVKTKMQVGRTPELRPDIQVLTEAREHALARLQNSQ